MAAPELSNAELAARYGFAMAVLDSDPELKKLFQRAVAETYTPERFQAELRATQWYQKHNEQWRNAAIQKAADPQTYKSNIAQVRTRLGMMATELGARVTGSVLEQMSESAYMLGWDDNQIRQSLAKYVSLESGRLQGQAGQWETDWREYAAAQGLTYSDKMYEHWARVVGRGEATVSDVLKQMQSTAASAYPHLAERINAGDTVEVIAEPYRQSMAALLELNPEGVSITDPTIRGALAAKDQDGKPVLRTLYDFENDLRKDQRWLKTKNAQDAAMQTTNRVLRDLGVIS